MLVGKLERSNELVQPVFLEHVPNVPAAVAHDPNANFTAPELAEHQARIRIRLPPPGGGLDRIDELGQIGRQFIERREQLEPVPSVRLGAEVTAFGYLRRLARPFPYHFPGPSKGGVVHVHIECFAELGGTYLCRLGVEQSVAEVEQHGVETSHIVDPRLPRSGEGGPAEGDPTEPDLRG